MEKEEERRGRGEEVREGRGGWEREREVVEEDRLELLVLGMMAEPFGCGRGKEAESTKKTEPEMGSMALIHPSSLSLVESATP